MQIEDTTRAGYERLVRLHIGPLLGHLGVGRLDGEKLDSFYRELRRCRTHCNRRRFDEHHNEGEHTRDKRCGAHRCRPLSSSSVRQCHNLLNGAFTRAVRWRWVGSNPVRQAEPPALPKADPQPPTPAQAAAIGTSAWRDPDWGMLVWLAMTTGARRGELCAVRWRDVDFTTALLAIGSSIGQLGTRVWENEWLSDLNEPSRQPAAKGASELSAAPYRRIADDLRGSIRCGALVPGATVPTVKELGARYKVAVGTAQRALSLLSDEGLIEIRRGRRGVVAASAARRARR